MATSKPTKNKSPKKPENAAIRKARKELADIIASCTYDEATLNQLWPYRNK